MYGTRTIEEEYSYSTPARISIDVTFIASGDVPYPMFEFRPMQTIVVRPFSKERNCIAATAYIDLGLLSTTYAYRCSAQAW